ncbi:diguanylate cyclase [Bacillus licheniformis]|nr:diguanylate cyclase [Bacillus licheniformis]
MVSRNGGEEFSVILPNCSHSQAAEIAERVRKEVETHTFSFLIQKDSYYGFDWSCGISGGDSQYGRAD